ncbi:MAG: tetratricopeptide repeat protein [Pontiella sp.]
MKNKKIVTVSTGVVVALFMFAGCSGKSGEKQYNQALSAWENGDLVRARTLLESSINKLSGNALKSTAQNQLGLVLWELGESEAAAMAFSTSANLAETLTESHLNMGIALYHTDRFDEAELALNNVLGENQNNETARAILGLIRLQKQNWTGATAELTKAERINPRSPAIQNALALAELHQTNNSDHALTRLKQLISAYPDYAPAAYNLGSIYDHWLQNTSTAIRWYQQYLQKAGVNGSHVQSASNAIVRLGGTPTTGMPSQTATESNPAEAARHMMEGAKLHGAQKYEEAISAYRRAIAADPKHKMAYYNMSLALYSQGNYRDTTTACNHALQIDSNFSDARYMLSLAYAKQEMWTDAEREARNLTKTDPTRGEQMKKYISDSRNR